MPGSHAALIVIGANDLIFSDKSTEALQEAALKVGAEIHAACAVLVKAGARKVLVGTLPNIEDSPMLAGMLGEDASFVSQLRRLISANLQFDEEELAAKCKVIDVFEVADRVLRKVQQEGWEV